MKKESEADKNGKDATKNTSEVTDRTQAFRPTDGSDAKMSCDGFA